VCKINQEVLVHCTLVSQTRNLDISFFSLLPDFRVHDFSRKKFPELFQASKIHINPFTPELVLLTVCHTFDIFDLSLTYFQNFPGPVVFFQDFPGFPGTVQTLRFMSLEMFFSD